MREDRGMPLRFGVDDEDEFYEAKDQLLAQLEEALGDDGDPEVVGNAGLLLDWRWGYSTGELDHYDRIELETYLLDWCPRKVSVDPGGYRAIIQGARTLILHLALTNAWRGGPVQPLLGYLDEVEPRFLDSMADPSKFGMAKGLFMGPGLSGPDIDLDDPDAIQAAMDRFNSQSFDERKAITDPLLDRMASGGIRNEDELAELLAEQAVDLPKTPAPDPALVAEQAAAAPFVRQLVAVADYLGKGKALTQTGNPKLVDARALVELFETGDDTEHTFGDTTTKVRSANELPNLQLVLDVAIGADALSDDPKKLWVEPDWAERPPLEQCEALLDAYLWMGPIEGRSPTNFMANIDGLLDAGILHWMVPVFLTGEMPVDTIVEQCLDVLDSDPEPLARVFDPEEFRRLIVTDRVEMALDAMERCGVLTWTGFELAPREYGSGFDRVGGVVHMTELGRHLLPDHLLGVGYRARTAIDLRAATAAEVVDELDDAIDLDPATAWSSWRPDEAPEAKFDSVLQVLVTGDSPAQRLGAVSLLAQAPIEVRRSGVVPLLDTPHVAYALMVLDPPDGVTSPEGDPSGMDAEADTDGDAGTGAGADVGPAMMIDGRSTDELMIELGPDLALPPMVDMLALQLEADPDDFIDQLGEFMPPEALVDLLTVLWRVPGPDSLALLEHIGRHHPDKATAKSARKAVVQHRSRHGSQ